MSTTMPYKVKWNQEVTTEAADSFRADLKNSLANMTSHFWDNADDMFDNNSTLDGYQPMEQEEHLETIMWVIMTMVIMIAGKQ